MMEKNNRELMLKSFEQYGQIKKFETDVADDVYLFSCKLKKITEDSLLKSLDTLQFLVLLDGFIVKIYCFNIAKFDKEQDKEYALDIINQVNNQTMYGKFCLDKDSDVDWEFSYEQTEKIEDIKMYLLSCAEGIKEVAFLSRELDQRSE